ncbi:integrase catalytic domain-containing protein [Trichonephila clavipes]|nr:integrase catalytic domain-containing protein [Trichonephila clavipes]
MQEVDEREECGMYFIPHLGVYRSDKKTSKLRVVFNASSATTNGYSLNSLQYNGGVAQNDLFSIMVRFRKHIFAFIADVQKMYRMIWINPDQRKLQRILWRENMDEPIKTFELSTVTYGTTSAPFLATRTLKQLALDEAGNFPLGSSVVMSDMYIDDVLTGAETLLEAKELKNQLINIFAKGGMVLHKWCGNNTELIEVSENYDFSDSSEIKVLGVYWNPKHDCFSFRVKIDLHELNTKRDVLSTIARIYDPLGLLGPVVAKAKIFLQKLWMLKIDWTDLLPDTINREWRQFVESLQVVNDININRCIVVEQPEVIELHGFSDASQSAYGAVVYCKSITSDGKMLVHLIASKSRVAPTKQTTIPRLELCAAVLLAKLVHRVKQALKLNVTNTFLWSDSMIVLSWIRKESYQLKTFVANRIATIQEMTSSEQWRYVATEDNPADFVSRGMDSLKLKTCELWWNGPKFLMSNQYPQRQIPVAVIKDPGRSITSIVEPDLTNLNENRLDNWQKITKIIQLIWKRWSVDYLNSLQQRNKWHFEKKNAKIGDMVIIKEDNLPSCQWSLGRINNIYPGKDSKVRVVEVKTTRGAKKEDLRRIASELELCVSDKLTVLDFMDLIKNCDRYKNDDSVHELANLIIEERKYDESQQLELEKIREKSKLDLEIARIRANDKDNNTEVNLPRITDMIPSQPFNVSLGNFSREKLADENFNIPGNIDLLLGAEIFYEILLPGQTNLLNTKLIFQNTVFGYIASGSIPVSSENKPHCGLIKDNVDLEKTMRRFWEIENVEPETIKNKETIICEEHLKNHTRDSTGRYIVSMPFKKDQIV